VRLALAVLVVALLLGLTAIAVLWWSAPRPVVHARTGPEPTGWKKLTGAAVVGLGAYAGGSGGTDAAAEISRGAGWL